MAAFAKYIADFVRKYTGPMSNAPNATLAVLQQQQQQQQQEANQRKLVEAQKQQKPQRPPSPSESPDPLGWAPPATEKLNREEIEKARRELLRGALPDLSPRDHTGSSSGAADLLAGLENPQPAQTGQEHDAPGVGDLLAALGQPATAPAGACQGQDVASLAEMLLSDDPLPSTRPSLKDLSDILMAAGEECADNTLAPPTRDGETATVLPELLCSPGLLRAFWAAEDTNIRGQKRQRRKPKVMADGTSRYSMEDTHLCMVPLQGASPDFSLFGVFDGFAGDDVSKELLSVLPEELAKHTAELRVSEEQGANAAVFGRVFSDVDARLKRHEFVGSTCTAALLWRAADGERYLQVANVGDSNAFLCRGGHAVPLSREHKASDEAEQRRLIEAGADITEGQTRLNGIAVSRAFGVSWLKDMGVGMICDPFVSPCMKLEAKDTFLVIASDGLWDVMSGQKACDLLKGETDARYMARKLISTALCHSKCTDNITVVIVCL